MRPGIARLGCGAPSALFARLTDLVGGRARRWRAPTLDTAARMIDDPRWIMLALGTITFVLVVLVVLLGLLGLRRGSGGDTGDILEADIREADAPGSSTRWIVGGGVVLPTLVIVVVLIATVGERRRVDAGVGTGPDGRPASSAI